MAKRATKGSTAVVSEPDRSLPEHAPQWMKMGFEIAQEIRRSGIKLPKDLAKNHDSYIRRARRA
jgi:hypothetical protein